MLLAVDCVSRSFKLVHFLITSEIHGTKVKQRRVRSFFLLSMMFIFLYCQEVTASVNMGN